MSWLEQTHMSRERKPMSQPFGGQKRRPRYDHDALVEMARTMTRRQIVQKTGISASHLDQVLATKGVGVKGKPP
jgi:hypothetical protein